jgi:TatA/E family protein of Tat protein translocase
MFSIPHMIIIFVVVLIVFGPQKLPELARGLGKLMAEFRKASGDFKTAFEQEMRDLERQATLAERKKQTDAAAASAAAEPAALAAPQGADQGVAEAEPPADTLLSEAPVASPVAESVPRSADETSGALDTPKAPPASADLAHDSHS